MRKTFYITVEQVQRFEAYLSGRGHSLNYRSAEDRKLGSLRVYEVEADDNLLLLARLAGWWHN